VLGIAGIALAFFVGRRLGGADGGPMLAALVALSPVAIRFSQQFREYVLVADVTLLTAWLLLRALVLLPLLSLALLACAMAVREARRSRAARLTIATVLATSVPLAVLDAWHHAHFSLVTRYQMTTWIGLQMAVAFALATAANSQRLAVRRLAVCGFVVIAGAGLGAAALDREYAEWWDNNDHVSESAVGAVVRAHAEAVVVSSDAPEGLFNTFVLARYLAPDTPMLLIGSKTPRTVPRGTTVFLFAPSSALRTRIAERLAMPPHNVSPDIGLAIPNLNAARADDPMREDNALWIVRSVSGVASLYF